ncbi:MAG: SdpI family protein [Bacillota bacterium]
MTDSRGHRMGPIIEDVKRDWMSVIIIAAMLITGVVLYSHLPERVPSHWNIHGEIDGYSSRFWGAFGIPFLTAGIYILMSVLPAIDPRKENYARFRGAYRAFKLVLTAFFAMLYTVILMNAMGYNVPVDRFVVTGVGLLFMVLGNFMGQLKHNYFVGIRTPWTLASEEVWKKTHRLSSRVWVVSGLIIAVTGLTLGGEKGIALFVAAILLAVIVPAAYSYILFRSGIRV